MSLRTKFLCGFGWLLLALVTLPIESRAQPHWHSIPAFDAQDLASDPYRDGVLWVASIGGLYQYDSRDGQWAVYSTPDGMSRAWGKSLFITSEAVWIGVDDGGANRFDRGLGRFTPFLQPSDPRESITVYALHVDSTGVWAGTDIGLIKTDPESLRALDTLTVADGLGENYILELADDGEYLWAATAFGGPVIGPPPKGGALSRIQKQTSTVESYRPQPSDSSSHFSTVADDGDRVWVGGVDGLFVFDKSKEEFTEVAPGQLGHITSVIVANDVVWCTAIKKYNELLYRIDRNSLEIKSETVLPVHFRPSRLHMFDGRLLLVKGAHFIEIAPNGSVEDILSPPFLPNPHCDGMAAGEEVIFVGCGSDLSIIDRRTYRPTNRITVFNEDSRVIRAIGVDQESLWLGTDVGLLKYSRQTLAREEVFVEGRRVEDVLLDDRYVWMLPGPGLHAVEKSTMSLVSITLKGVLGTVDEPLVKSMLLDGDVAWIGISGLRSDGSEVNGVVRVDARIFRIETAVEVQDGPFTAMVDAGSHIVAGGRQILALEKTNLTSTQLIDEEPRRMILEGENLWVAYGNILNGGLKVFDVRSGREALSLGTSDGLLHNYVTNMYVSARHAWFATFAGVSVVDLASLPLSVPRPGRLDELNSLQIFPNPFRHRAVITIHNRSAYWIRLELYDALGRKVAILHDGPLGYGDHSFEFNGDHLPTGLYFCRLRSETASQTISLVHVR